MTQQILSHGGVTGDFQEMPPWDFVGDGHFLRPIWL